MNKKESETKNLLKSQIKVSIDSLNINGEGVANFNNKKVCVSGVLPKEEVLCEVETEKPTFLGCKKIDILKCNPNRIKPKCPYSGVCGGCDLDFIDYDNSASLKQKIIKDYFIDFYDGQVEFVKSDNCIGYRNKVSFFIFDKKLGFKQKFSNKIVEIDKCLLANKNINNIIDKLKESLTFIKSSLLTHIVVRNVDDKLILSYVFKKYNKDTFLKLKQFALDKFKNIQDKVGVYININNIKSQILGDDWYHVFGLKYHKIKIQKDEVDVHPYSFLQVNSFIMNKIYNNVLLEVEDKVVIEGYSGVGIMSLMLSKKAKEVYSVEINKQSFLTAQKLKQDNNIVNLTNINDSCANVLPNLVEQNPNSIFLIDPPRSGCDVKTLEALNRSNINKIIYISCNPYTLKQNIGFLKNNYKIKKITAYDMFPNTSHIETVVVLQKK